MTEHSIYLPSPVHRLAELGLAEPLLAALDKYPSAPMEFEDGDNFATPLMLAATNGRAECLKILLPLSDPFAVDHDHFSALMLAAAGSHPDCVEILLPASNPAHQSTHGRDALMIAAARAANGSLECCKLLLPGNNPLAASIDGRTALMMAAEHGNFQVVSLLAPLSNVRHASRTGMTALMEAACANSLESVEALAPLSDCFAIDAYGFDAIAHAAQSHRSLFIPAIISAAAKMPSLAPRLDFCLHRSLRLCCNLDANPSCSAILNSALDVLPRHQAIALFRLASECSQDAQFKARSAAVALALQEQLDLDGAATGVSAYSARKSMRI